MFDKEELANDNIPTGGSPIEMADWEIEAADSTTDSPKVGMRHRHRSPVGGGGRVVLVIVRRWASSH